MNSPTLTIAVISHEQRHLVKRLLDSIALVKPTVDFRIILVENVKYLEPMDQGNYRFHIIYLENEKPLSLSSNLNKVFAAYGKDSEYFCILNPDVSFDHDVFATLIKTLDRDEVGLIAPLVLNGEGEIQDSFRALPSPKEVIMRFLGMKREIIDPNSITGILDPDWIAAMFMLLRSEVFFEIGGFDPRYRLYFEDVDFCTKIRQKGFRVSVDTSVSIIHDANRASRKDLRFLGMHLISAIKFFSSSIYWKARKGF